MKDVAVLIEDYKFNFRVCALIENKNRYLLQKSDSVDFYNMPGGRVHAGENTFYAIKRELKEELDLDVKNPKLIKIAEEFFVFENKKYHEIDFVYYIKLKNNNILCTMNNFKNKDNEKEKMFWIHKKMLKNYKILPEFIYTIKNSKKTSHLVFDKINNFSCEK